MTRFLQIAGIAITVILSMMAIGVGLIAWLGAMDDTCTGTGTAGNAFTRLCTSSYGLVGVFIIMLLGIMTGLVFLFRANRVRESIKYSTFGVFVVWAALIVMFAYQIWTLPIFLSPTLPPGFEGTPVYSTQAAGTPDTR